MADKANEIELKHLLQMAKANGLKKGKLTQSGIEHELKLTSKMAQLARDKTNSMTMFEFLLKAAKEQTPEVRARTFEFATLRNGFEMANTQLKHLSNENKNLIDKRYLHNYFEACMDSDNLDGLAYLTHYCEKHNVDVGSWDFERVRPALNHYLNGDFNASKVLAIVKFYTHYHQCRLQKTDIGETDQDRHVAQQRIFGTSEDVVDMKALFHFMVKSLGSQALVDPLSKEDALWPLIDFFTKDVFETS